MRALESADSPYLVSCNTLLHSIVDALSISFTTSRGDFEMFCQTTPVRGLLWTQTIDGVVSNIRHSMMLT